MKETDIKILASLISDSMEGWGWISNNIVTENGFYILKLVSGKEITCYLRVVDWNYIHHYNSGNTYSINQEDKILIINEYYRKRLGLCETNIDVKIEITKCNLFRKLINFEFSHPNPYVRSNYRMTIISILLGIISLGLTILTILNNL